jgi:hypothetical protein
MIWNLNEAFRSILVHNFVENSYNLSPRLFLVIYIIVSNSFFYTFIFVYPTSMNFISQATRAVARPAVRRAVQVRHMSNSHPANDVAQREIGIGLVLGLIGGVAWMGYAKSEKSAVDSYYRELAKKNGN